MTTHLRPQRLLTATSLLTLLASGCSFDEVEADSGLLITELEPGEDCPAGGLLLEDGRRTHLICHGADGADGQPGQDGADGAPGADGADGRAVTIERVTLAPGEGGCEHGGAVLLLGVEGEREPDIIEVRCHTDPGDACPPGQQLDEHQGLCAHAWTFEFEGVVRDVPAPPHALTSHLGQRCHVALTLDATLGPTSARGGSLYFHAPSSLHGLEVRLGEAGQETARFRSSTEAGLEISVVPLHSSSRERVHLSAAAPHVTGPLTVSGGLDLSYAAPEVGNNLLALPRRTGDLDAPEHITLTLWQQPGQPALECALSLKP